MKKITKSISYYPNGQIQSSIELDENGDQVGNFTEYYSTGGIRYLENWNKSFGYYGYGVHSPNLNFEPQKLVYLFRLI